MMIKYLQSIFKVGDLIQISGSNGQVTGMIELFADDFMVLKREDGTIVGVKEEAISSFSTVEQRRDEPSNYQQNGRNDYVALYNDRNNRNERNERNGFQQPYFERGQNIFRQNRYGGYPRPQHEEQRVAPKKQFREFKPGDKIPLEELKHRDPALASNWRKREEERAFSRELLNTVTTAIDQTVAAQRAEDEVTLSGMGAIVELQPSFQFGFIDDLQTGERYFFNRGDLVDPELLDLSGEEIEVIYFRTKNHKGPAARTIHRPNTVRGLLKLVRHLATNDDVARGKQVLENILSLQSDNQSAKEVLTAIESVLQKQEPHNTRQNVTSEGESAYHAARVHLNKKEYNEALQYYFKALEQSDRKANCIKEIAQVYISMHSQESDEVRKAKIRETGLRFIDEYKEILPDQHNTLFSLENIYFALGDYEKHKEVTSEIIKDSYEREDWGQYVFYQNKMAQSYLRTNQYDEGLEAAEAGLEIEPHNAHLLKTKASLEEAMSVDEDVDDADDGDDSTLHSRFSKYY